MNTLNAHEITILSYILNKDAMNESPVSKHAIISELIRHGYSPTVTAIKILDLEKKKVYIQKVSIDFNNSGYLLSDEGERWVIDNVSTVENEIKQIESAVSSV